MNGKPPFPTPTVRRLAGALLLLVFWALLPGRSPAADDNGIRRQYSAGPLQLVMNLSADTVTVADSVSLTLTVTWPEDGGLLPPSPPDGPLFTVQGWHHTPPRLTDDGRLRQTFTLSLQFSLPASITIPPLTFSYTEPDGARAAAISTDALVITVTSLLDDDATAAPADILPPRPLPGTRWLPVAGLAVVLAGGAAVLYRRRRRHTGQDHPCPSAADAARRQLQQLDSWPLTTQQQRQAFFIQLSDILRHYIETRFAVRARKMTTDEFIHHLRTTPEIQITPALEALLCRCDLVKFAHATPAATDCRAALALCRQFIETTTAPENPPTPAPPDSRESTEK